MKIKLLPLLFICFILIQSCEKPDPNGCHNAITYYKYLSETARNQTPYFTNPAFDTISFASDKGDTVTFVKTKTDSSWYKEEISGNPACDWDKNYYQILHNKYITIIGNGELDVKFECKNSRQFPNNLNIQFSNLRFDINTDWLNPLFGYAYTLGDIYLKNRLFKNTIYSYSTLGDTASNYLIVNKDFGIVKINNKTENISWILIKP
jgi:hypothetical protein